MNIEIKYNKVGESDIPLNIKLHNLSEIFYNNEFLISENNGSLQFYCDWPFHTESYLEFSTQEENISSDYITFIQFIFDDFWNSVDLTHRGKNIPSNTNTNDQYIDTQDSTSNSLFFAGTLQYKIPHRPLCNWTMHL